jgi:hypothetical protein
MTVWTKLEGNEYRNRQPYPERPRKPSFSHMSNAGEMRAYADSLEQYDGQLKLWRADVAAWNARSAALEAEFQHDLEVEYHMVGHHKAELLYGKAWQMGHSSGLHEVANCYANLVELVI